jgi:hypothetical protein
MTAVTRALVALDSHDPEAWQVAVTLADKLCSESGGAIRDVVLLIHTKAQLKHTDLANHMGAAQAKALDSGQALSMPSGAQLRCETVRTLSYLSAKTVVIVYWAEAGILDHADGFKGPAAIIAVPEYPDSADQWEERWKPTVYGRTAKAPTTLIADPVVENALKSLTTLVNLSTGLGHPRDKDHAKDILRILRVHDHKAESEKVKSWAITHGWRPKDAAELAALADKILGQKTKPSLSGLYNAKERYERWL